MDRTMWTPVLGWIGAIGAALALALAAPNERGLLGKLPSFSAKRLDQVPIALPHELPSDRTLAVVVFDKAQRERAQAWIDGMGLREPGNRLAWMRIPVVHDPGDEAQRRRIEQVLMERYPDAEDRARLVPVFTDRQAFVRAAGLPGTAEPVVLVLDRQGHVLARASGPYDPVKAAGLRQTAAATNDFALVLP